LLLISVFVGIFVAVIFGLRALGNHPRWSV
jgi:hypothetical protein